MVGVERDTLGLGHGHPVSNTAMPIESGGGGVGKHGAVDRGGDKTTEHVRTARSSSLLGAPSSGLLLLGTALHDDGECDGESDGEGYGECDGEGGEQWLAFGLPSPDGFAMGKDAADLYDWRLLSVYVIGAIGKDVADPLYVIGWIGGGDRMIGGGDRARRE
jgi:hypothetical protein